MKKLFIITLALIALLGVVFGVALYNLNSLISAFKPTIEESISSAIGSEVTFTSIEASGFPQLKIKLSGASIKGKSDVSIPDLILDVSLIPLLSNKIEISSISVDNARIAVKSGEKEYLINDLSAKARVSLIEGKTVVPNIDASAKVLENEEISIKGENLSFEKEGLLNLGSTNLTARGNTFHLSGYYDTKKSSGEIKIDTQNLSLPVGVFKLDSGKGVLNVTASSTESVIKTDGFTFNLNNEPFSVSAVTKSSKEGMHISPLKLSAFSGNATGDLSSANNGFNANISTAGMQVAPLMRFLNPAAKEILTGTMTKASAELKGATQGNIALGISGPFRALIENGELRGINLGGKVLGATKGIPLIEGALLSRVPEKYQRYFTSENTPIRSLTVDGSLGGGNVSLSKVVLISDAFTLTSSGRAAIGGAIDLNARITFNKEVSEGIVGSIKELAKILNSDGTLEIPLQLQGTPPAIVVIPDVGRLIELAAKGALREKAGEAIGRELEKRGLGKDTQKAIEGLFGF